MAETAGVTEQDVLRVAELANLDLTADEVPRMQRDLNAILGHIAQLNELDTRGVPAMAQVGEMLGAEPELMGASLRADAARRRFRKCVTRLRARRPRLRRWLRSIMGG